MITVVKAGERIRSETVTLASSPYLARVTRSTNQSIPHNTATTINYTNEVIDTDGLFTITSPGIMTIQHGGVYGCDFTARLESGGNNTIAIVLFIVVGTTVEASVEMQHPTPFPAGFKQASAGLLFLSAGQTVFTQVYQLDNSSSARNVTFAAMNLWYISDGS